ncbi:hypothetical protein CVT25_015820 [Psilocybe cyanescens]|uniref:Uncharacterized protein n=1 Tax=Psilocybe cyanescens TaxID=93625 RepID=A0A409XIG4_PSICY|nr:hypothetical protein CVT25_015820 [Psilocybe cyanescens]
MQSSRLPSDSSPLIQGPNTSMGSDATNVSSQYNVPVDEAGFKAPLMLPPNHRTQSDWSNKLADQVEEPVPKLAYEMSGYNENSTNPLLSKEKLDSDPQADENHVQFATYRPDKLRDPVSGIPSSPNDQPGRKFFVPLPLRVYFWIPLVVFLVLGAIGLEVALHFSNKNQGWPSKQSENASNAMHYVYTLPPVIVAAVVVAMWAWTDIEIKKIQPYVDLVHGNSPPHRSLLLDYTRQNNFLVWTQAASNKHYLVALATLMVLMTLSFQPLASALLVVKDTWTEIPNVNTKNIQAISLNQNLQFNDLSSFLAAAGYAGASVLYDLAPPPFVRLPYTVAEFTLPTVVSNGTVFANTNAIKSNTNCQAAQVQMTQTDPGRWTNTASLNDCSITFSVVNTTDTLFGTDTPSCTSSSTPDQFSQVAFWFFSYVPFAQASVTFCFPTIELREVNVGVDVGTGNVTQLSDIRQFSSSSNFSSLSANVTGAPLNGRAYNGIKFQLSTPDQFILARENATQLQLPASIYQAAVKSPQGYVGSFEAGTFHILSDQVYSIYLALIARQVYYLPDNEDLTVLVRTFRKHVWISDVAAHLLAVAMLILALFGTLVHLFHREDRRNLRLKHEPGTIASAVSIGASTGVGNVLANRHGEEEMKEALRDLKFRIDTDTMKIVMEGEPGYETAKNITTPMTRRRSIFEVLQRSRPVRTFSGNEQSGTPTALSPTSPKSPNLPKEADMA